VDGKEKEEMMHDGLQGTIREP